MRCVCLRRALFSIGQSAKSRSVELENRLQAVFWSAISQRAIVRERWVSDQASSPPNTDPQSETAVPKADLSRNQASRVIFNVLVKALVNGDFKKPVDLFSAMDELKMISTVKQRNELLVQLQRVNAVNAMSDFMEYMKQRKMELNENTYSTIVSACKIESDLEEACQDFDQRRESSDIPATEYTYQSIIGLCIDCGDLERAGKYFNEMVNAGVRLDARVLVPVFRKLGYEKQHSAVAAILCTTIMKEMESQGVKLNREICSSALWTYSNAGCADSLLALYEIAKKLRMKFDLQTYHVVLFGLAKKSEYLEMAARVLRDMKKDGIRPELYTYHLLLRIFAAARDEVRALALFKELEKAGLKPTLFTYNSIFPAFRKTFPEDKRAQMWQSIDSLLEKMQKQGFGLDSLSYRTLVNICVFNGSRDRAESLLDEMKENGIRLNNRNFVKLIKLEAQCDREGDETAGAYRISALLEQMDEEGLRLNRPCCVDVMYGFLNSKSAKKMQPFMKKMRQVGIRYDRLLLELLIRFWLSVGNEAMADKVIEEALEQGRPGSDVTASHLRVLIDLGKTSAVVEQLQKMKSNGFSFDSNSVRGVLINLKQANLPEGARSQINAILRSKSRLLQV